MLYPFQVPLFENYNPKILIVVDVQEEFCEFFPCDYLKKIYWFAEQFKTVYQIWDNHESDRPSYKFENQVDTIAKNYGGEVDESDVERMTEESQARFKEDSETGEYYGRYDYTDGTAIFFIGMGEGADPGHMWFTVNTEYLNLLEELKHLNADVVLVGGGKWECIYDVEITLQESGINYNYNDELVFDSQSGCQTQNNCDSE